MKMVYGGCKIYGPYIGKDARLRIIVIWPNGFKTTISYPKYLVECKLNRYLKDNETVHHIDGDFLNNDDSNLVVLDRSIHAKQDSTKPKIPETFTCIQCNKSFTVEGKRLYDLKRGRDLGKKGSYCSRRCSGIGSHSH